MVSETFEHPWLLMKRLSMPEQKKHVSSSPVLSNDVSVAANFVIGRQPTRDCKQVHLMKASYMGSVREWKRGYIQ
jgi:hypothetical protein